MFSFNADSGVCKSDLIGRELQCNLQETFPVLQDQSAKRVKPDPGIDLFQLVYGRFSVFDRGCRPNLLDGEISFPITACNTHVPRIPEHADKRVKAEYPGRTFQPDDSITWRMHCWSNRFQWLHCEVYFTDLKGVRLSISTICIPSARLSCGRETDLYEPTSL